MDVEIERGKLTVLLGASGSGKTTLLTLMGCLRRVQDGSIRLLGHELAGADEDVLVLMRRRLGFIFQAHNLHESLTAIQNVRMGLDVHGQPPAAPGAKPPRIFSPCSASRTGWIISRQSLRRAETTRGDCPRAGGQSGYCVCR